MLDNTVFLCFDTQTIDFSYQLVADLKKIGVDVWPEQFDLSSKNEWPDTLFRCSVSIIVLADFTPAMEQQWRKLLRYSEEQELRVVTLHIKPDVKPILPADAKTFEFVGWRNTRIYAEHLTHFQSYLTEIGLVSDQLRPSPEEQYIHSLVAEINRYRAFLESISPRSDALPSDKRAIYARSMWGLTGVFELPDVIKSTNMHEVTYQFHEIVEKLDSFALVGHAGSGKTITLYRALLDTLRAYRTNRNEAPLPILINLGLWKPGQSLAEFLEGHRYSDEIAFQAIESDKLFLIDGLDEIHVSEDAVETLKNWVEATKETATVVLACREEHSDLIAELELPVVYLRELDVPRIRQFVVNHLEQGLAEELLEQIIISGHGENPDTAIRISRNALLLAILVGCKQTSVNETVPLNIGYLLDWFARHLWSTYAEQPPIPYEALYEGLSQLAFDMIELETATWVSYDWAIEHVPQEHFLQFALDSQIMHMRGDMITFSQRFLRDYFATWRLLEDEGVYTRLMRAQFDAQSQRINWKWDQVIMLSSGLVSHPDRFVTDISQVNPYLALECIAGGAQTSEKTREIVIQDMLNFSKSIGQDYLNKIMKSLENVVEANAMPALLEHLHRKAEAIPQTVSSQSVNEDVMMPLKELGAGTIRFLMEILSVEKWQRRRGAAWALGEIKEPAAVPSLIEALRDENVDVRQEAAHALLRIGRPALPRLINCLHDENVDLRAIVIKVLGQLKDATTVPHLIASLPDTSWPESEEIRICDLAAIALEAIGTDEALAAVDRWKQGSKSAPSESKWKDRVQATNPKAQAAAEEEAISGQLLSQLQDPDWGVRRDLIKELGDSKEKKVIPYLLDALDDADSQVRWTAVEALSKFDHPTVIEGLLGALHDEDALVFDSAAKNLIGFGSAAVPGLIEALEDENVDVRGAAAEALGLIGDEVAIPHLADALADRNKPRCEDKRVCDIAAEALKQIGTEKAIFTLSNYASMASQPVIRGDPISSPLIFMDEMGKSTKVVEEDAQLEKEAQSFALQEQHKTILLRFLDALNNEDWHAQKAAAKELQDYAKTLHGTEDYEVIERLTSALLNQEHFVRWTATEALAWLGNTQATPALIARLKDDSWTVRIAAIRALEKIQHTADEEAQSEEVQNSGIAVQSVQGTQLASEEVISALETALSDKVHLVREAAAETLGIIKDKSARTALLGSLADPDGFVRRAAVEALGQIQYETGSALEDILPLLNDSDIQVRWSVIETLGKIGDEEALSHLMNYLDDETSPSWEDRRICDVVAEAIGNIGTVKAQAILDDWRKRRVQA